MLTNWSWKNFSELSNLELYHIMRLRQEVFFIEQKMHYIDADLKDIKSKHLFLKNQLDEKIKIVAYLRIIPPGSEKLYPMLGRILVNSKYRGQGYGKKLIQKALSKIATTWPSIPVEVHAQENLRLFYESLGFKMISEPFMEQGISHLRMLSLIEKKQP